MNVRLALLSLGLLPSFACADNPQAPDAPQADLPAASFSADVLGDVPARAGDPRYTFVNMPDDSLWSQLAQTDTTALVGLKAPGARRGTYKGRTLVAATEKATGEQAVAATSGITLLNKRDELPIIRVKIADEKALTQLRRLPFVDYVEPNLSRDFSYSGGCSNDPWSGARFYSPSGDVLPEIYARMGIDLAWNRSSGRGITVGDVDTGIYGSNPELTGSFVSGASTNRFTTNLYIAYYSSPYITSSGCSHGTRMAGLIAAPRNGVGAIGVAWGANFVSVKHNDDVAVFDAGHAIDGISAAAQRSNIIAMAWGAPFWYSSIEATIEYWHYNYGRLFIGATGTTPTCGFYPWDAVERYTQFPARMSEVVAVSAADLQNRLACDSHSGAEVAAYYGYPTTGISNVASDVFAMRGSSSATAVVAGAAALIWSRFGTNRDDVRARLRQGASQYPHSDGQTGFGVINVMKSLGGMTNTNLNGCSNMRWQADCQFSYKLLSCTPKSFSVSPIGGSGSYSYSWSTGSTSSSTSLMLCPTAGRTEYYGIAATVTDNSDGTSIYKHVNIGVTSSDPDGACPTCPV